MAYDPNEPRDKEGKWTSGGGILSGGIRRMTPAEKTAYKNQKQSVRGSAVVSGLLGGVIGGAFGGPGGLAIGGLLGAYHGASLATAHNQVIDAKASAAASSKGRAGIEAARNRRHHGTGAVVKTKHDSVKSKGSHANRSKAVVGPIHHDVMKSAKK